MKNNQAGQSTVEFIFSFVFAVSLILMVFNTALNYVSGYMVHYATFMASRVFLTQDSNDNVWNAGDRGRAADAAQETFKKYRLGVFGINSELRLNDDQRVGPGEYLMVGAYAQFERKIDLIGKITGETKLELISESFLGREPSRGVCASRVCFAISGNPSCDENMDITLFDDGC